MIPVPIQKKRPPQMRRASKFPENGQVQIVRQAARRQSNAVGGRLLFPDQRTLVQSLPLRQRLLFCLEGCELLYGKGAENTGLLIEDLHTVPVNLMGQDSGVRPPPDPLPP